MTCRSTDFWQDDRTMGQAQDYEGLIRELLAGIEDG
jgi:hypothetical protein